NAPGNHYTCRARKIYLVILMVRRVLLSPCLNYTQLLVILHSKALPNQLLNMNCIGLIRNGKTGLISVELETIFQRRNSKYPIRYFGAMGPPVLLCPGCGP